ADIARRHGGRLATAPSGRGACLVLELPALRTHDAPLGPPSRADAPTDPLGHAARPGAPPAASSPPPPPHLRPAPDGGAAA
ncbi:MAG TPA: hypothetical protein VHF89_15445, partial [Solirubrobacteraceae bacterium]|nr:hypothetical protein [Solirubrobacteraceae bacterium]